MSVRNPETIKKMLEAIDDSHYKMTEDYIAACQRYVDTNEEEFLNETIELGEKLESLRSLVFVFMELKKCVGE